MSKFVEPAVPEVAARPRVLIVDDEPDSATTMARLLARMGADVETANDGGQALDAVAKFDPQIVLLDIGMPMMDGYEAARRIRENASGRRLTLVAMTGWTRDEDQHRAHDAGFDHHLAKPVDPAALERLLADPPGGWAPPAPVAGRASPSAPTAPSGALATMSHEIRTPLNTIAGAALLLLDSPLDEEQRGLVRLMRRSGEALCAIVDDLMDLAAIEAGTLRLDEAPFSPSAVVDEVLELVGGEAAERRIELTSRVEPSVPAALVGDVGRVRRLLLFHARRAVASAVSGGVSLTLASRPMPDCRVQIHVCAGDAGDGAPQALAAPSESPPAARSASDDDGNDVACRVGELLCGRMGGRMWIEDDAPRGVERHFTFVASQARTSELREKSGTPVAALRVLVADDDPVVRRTAMLLLADLDVVVDVAANGREAVVAAARTPYDAVLLDARMPEMDGAEAVREIRRAAPSPRGPRIIAMTASTARADHESLLAAGADACLTKPLQVESLRDALAGVRPSHVARDAAPQTLDAAVMKRLRSGRTTGGPAVFAQLIGLFLDDTPSQMTKLRQAAILGDAADVELVAHRLRGSSASIGATRLMSLAADLESLAPHGDAAAVAGAIEALDGAWLVTRSALERERRNLR